jgi:hypothetical protein
LFGVAVIICSVRRRYEYFFNCESECLMHLAHASYFGGPLNYDMWKRFTSASDLFHQGSIS